MTPFRYTMSLVNSYASQLLLFVNEFQMAPEVFGCALFGGNIKQAGDRVASGEVPEDTLFLRVWCVVID